MDMKSVSDEGKLAYNVISLHVDISASNPTSVIVTGNTANVDQKSIDMPNSCVLKRPFIGNIGARTRSVSAGRDKKSDLRARYWASLFENLQHAIYKLYQTCETDENISECEEVILVLENYTREFHELAKWFRMKCEFENAPPSQRPTSVAWGVSKSSPGKIFRKSSAPPKPDSACRELIFELDPEARDNVETSGVLPLQMKLNLNSMNAIGEQILENNGDNLLQQVDMKTKPSTKAQSIDSSCQTDDDMLAVKKTVPPNRRPVLSSPSYSRKFVRNLSIPTLSEKSTQSTSSTSSTKRLSGCISPKKPVPGRNIAAPVFVPGKKLSSLTKTASETKPAADTPSKTKIARSHSDSAFETTSHSLKNQSNQKAYASVECVRNLGKEDSGPKSPVLNPMQVIVEHKVTEPTTKDVTLETIKFHEKDTGRLPTAQKVSSAERISAQEPVVVTPSISERTEKPVVESSTSTKATMMTVDTSAAPISRNSVVDRVVHSTTSIVTNSVPSAVQNIAVTQPNVPTTTSCVKKTVPVVADKKQVSDIAPKKVDVARKTSTVKNNPSNRSGTRQWDAKSSQPVVASRKTNAVSAPPVLPRTSNNQNSYVKTVGVPKTSNDAKIEKRLNSERNAQTIANPVVSSATPVESRTMPKASGNNGRTSYVTITKAKAKEFDGPNTRPLSKEPESSKRYSNMIRSKTSVDFNPKSHETSKLSAAAKTGSEERDPLPRSRRSSKDTDGWETVISRSRRSIPSSLNAKDKFKVLDVSKRFYEPSPSTSLPSLAMGNCKEKSPECARSEKNKNRNRSNHGPVGNGSAHKPNSVEKVDNSGRNNDFNYKLNKERPIISSMFTTAQSKRKKSSEKDSKRPKLKESKRKSSKESDAQDASHIEDQLNEESLRKSEELREKEISLQKEINDLQNDDSEMDADSDSAEIDFEIAELYQNRESTAAERRALLEVKYNHLLSKMTWAEQVETLDKLEELMERDPSGRSLKFAKNFTSLKQFEDFMMRWPGRALELHQKLSSPSRKRTSPDSTILQHRARQAKAKEKREQLLQDKSAKVKELFNKIGVVKAMQEVLIEERRKLMVQKQKRAEENRNLHLKNIQEKAHDEAKKQKEIAFINELEAQNKRHDFLALCQEQEDRLQSILGDRQRKLEEKAAKEAAVGKRLKALEAEYQEKIEELQEKMRKREERIDREFQEKERERLKVAREKARDREDRLLARQAAQIANAEELQKKIQQKQENSARRHEESIELIRQRAIIIGTPRLTPYQINKLCSVCNVLIDSEVFLLSHLRGFSHQEALRKYREQFEASVKFSERSIIMDAPADILREKKSREKERQKTLRKRCKKIRQRLASRSAVYLKEKNAERETVKKTVESPNKKRIVKSIKEIEKLINTQGVGVWSNNTVTSLERNLFEIIRLLEKGDENDQRAFAEFDGFAMLSRIYNFALDLPKSTSPYLPLKCFVVASNLYISACNDHVDNCLYVLLSNNIVQILEFLLNRLNLIMPNSDDRNGMVVYKADTVADALMHLCSTILSNVTSLSSNGTNEAEIESHLQDVVSYIVCTGIVDKLAVYCSSVHDDKSANSFFLLHAIQFLTRLVETRRQSIADKEDCTSLMATLKATELVGAVSMLYAMLLHQDSMLGADHQSSTIVLQPDVVNVIIVTLRLFSRVCELNLEFFQNILGAEGISLQVRHIISYLLKYCVQNEGYVDLLHQVIEFIGFFAIHHHENQMILQSGSTPTVLQQLSNLPFAYFSNPKLVRILFPTLLACCVDNPQNKMILDQEMSFQLLEDFKNSEDSKDIPLIKLLR